MVKWKREKVQDHKFDFVDLYEFEKKDFFSRIKYTFVFFIVLKSVLVYLGDIYTAGSLILLDKSGAIRPAIPLSVTKWIFVASIAISFVLLFLEVKKAKKIIASGDISFAFTSNVAYRYYTLTSYVHWCFFQEIINHQKTQDKIAFFVFFAFKGWKRLVFCDGPRQLINAYTLYTIIKTKGFTTNLRIYGGLQAQATLGVMIFTVSVLAMSASLLCIAFVLYLPLLCKIQGNLKEYCCHIIDKRISQILEKQGKKKGKTGKHVKSPSHLKGVNPTIPDVDNNSPYNQVSPPPQPPMMYNNYGPPPTDPYLMGRPNPNISRNPTPQSSEYTEYMGRRGSDSSQGIAPIYGGPQVQQPVEYPPRPNSNNSVYSDASTKYSGNGRPPYQYPPQPQYPPYQQIPPSGAGGYVVDQQSSYNYQNVPHPNNQYHDDGNNYNPYSPPPPSQSPQSMLPPDARYQQNRPYQAPGRY